MISQKKKKKKKIKRQFLLPRWLPKTATQPPPASLLPVKEPS
jgi:hypothetical protein